MTLSHRSAQAAPDETMHCVNCAHVRTFKPRKDEQHRFGFTDIGYGCQKSGYEGYTAAFSTCTFFSAISKANGL